jgi:hypothetical protein
MQASHCLIVLTKFMVTIFVGLGICSLTLMFRSLSRPLAPTPEKLATMKKLLPLSTRFLLGSFAIAAFAVISKQYYLLAASALLFSLVLPLIVHYMRLKAALRGTSGADLCGRDE